jgi:hypothetical protein
MFGSKSMEVIEKTRTGSLYHPSQEELFEEVIKILDEVNTRYIDVIIKIKEKYPQYKDVNFDITDGVLGCVMDSRYPVNNINELQQFVNMELGQDKYLVKVVGYTQVYASSEAEALEFAKNEKYGTPIEAIRIDN